MGVQAPGNTFSWVFLLRSHGSSRTSAHDWQPTGCSIWPGAPQGPRLPVPVHVLTPPSTSLMSAGAVDSVKGLISQRVNTHNWMLNPSVTHTSVLLLQVVPASFLTTSQGGLVRSQRGEPARGQRWQGVSLRNLKPPTAAFPRGQFCMGLPSLHRADNLAGNRSLLTFLPPE